MHYKVLVIFTINVLNVDSEVMKSTETQTDCETMITSNDMEVEPSVDYVICEGNNDESF